MKKLILTSALFLAFYNLNAQKVASMNYQEVLLIMPEAKKVQTELETFSKTKETELLKLQDAFKKDVEKYQQTAAKLTEAQRSAKEAELTKAQDKLKEVAGLAQNDLAKKRETLLQPVIDKLNGVIEKVSKANSIDFIIDSSALIYKNGLDATPLVKKELGL